MMLSKNEISNSNGKISSNIIDGLQKEAFRFRDFKVIDKLLCPIQGQIPPCRGTSLLFICKNNFQSLGQVVGVGEFLDLVLHLPVAGDTWAEGNL